jgi:hypothetical protein
MALAAAASIAVVACSTGLQPISANPPGSPGASAPRALVLRSAYVRHRVGTVTFPAGRYTAQFTDARGTYYVAPTRIVSDVFGSHFEEGGFYAPFANGAELRAYLIDNAAESGSHAPYLLVGGTPGLSYYFER